MSETKTNNGYEKVVCDDCGQEFSRYIAHPYITKCPKCRTWKAKQRAKYVIIDGRKVNKTDIDKLLSAGRRGVNGKVHSNEFKSGIDMVTYDRGTFGPRFYRIENTIFMNEVDLLSFVESV